MHKHAKEYKEHYPTALGAALLFVIMGAYLITRSDYPREAFIHQKGTIAYLSQVHPLKPDSEPRLKDVYLVLKEYQRIFVLFTGTDPSDFSPRINRLDELNVGDKIDIYYDETAQTSTRKVNNLLQYLDKNGELYYLRSRADKYIGYVILGCSVLLLILGIYMKVYSKE